MTDFDEFLRKRNEAESLKARDLIMNLAGADHEWQRLKGVIRMKTEGKAVGLNKFEWSPYPASRPDFLRLRDVAATFIALPKTLNAPGNFLVVFARRPPSANELWIDDEPLPAMRWLLTAEAENAVFYWAVKANGVRLPTEGLADEIAKQLVLYHDDYTVALKAKFPGYSWPQS